MCSLVIAIWRVCITKNALQIKHQTNLNECDERPYIAPGKYEIGVNKFCIKT